MATGMPYDHTAIRDVSPWLDTVVFENPMFLSLFREGNYRDGVGGVSKNLKFEWYDRSLTPPQGTIGTEAASGQADVILGTDEGAKFTAGDTVMFKGVYPEFGKVLSIATDTLTLESNLTYTHAVGVVVLNTSRPLAVGSYQTRTGRTAGTARYNYHQKFGRTYGCAKETLAQLSEDAVKSEMAIQADEKMIELAWEMNGVALGGPRGSAEADGTIQTAGGLLWWIMQNSDSDYKVNAAGASLTGTLLNNLFQLTGGRANAVVVHSDQQRMISKINENTGTSKFIVIDQNSGVAGYKASAKFLTDIPAYGEKIAIVDDNMPKNMLAVVNTQKMWRVPLKGCKLTDGPKTNSDFNGFERAIDGNYTFQFQDIFTDYALMYNLADFS